MPKGQYERTPEMRAKWAENMRRVRVSRGWPASAHAPEKQAARADAGPMIAGYRRWRAAKPDEHAEALHRAGLVSASRRYLCECGRTIYGPAAFRHANATGHIVTKQDADNYKESA